MCGTPDWESDNLQLKSAGKFDAHDRTTPARRGVDLEEHEGDIAEYVSGPVLQAPFLHDLLILDHSQHFSSNAAVH